MDSRFNRHYGCWNTSKVDRLSLLYRRLFEGSCLSTARLAGYYYQPGCPSTSTRSKGRLTQASPSTLVPIIRRIAWNILERPPFRIEIYMLCPDEETPVAGPHRRGVCSFRRTTRHHQWDCPQWGTERHKRLPVGRQSRGIGRRLLCYKVTQSAAACRCGLFCHAVYMETNTISIPGESRTSPISFSPSQHVVCSYLDFQDLPEKF